MVEKKLLDQIYAYIDANEENIVNDLKEIASMRSVTLMDSDIKPFGQECIDVLDKMLKKGEAEGFETHNYENYVGTINHNVNAEKEIGLWAHLDVVPEGELSEWLADPYKPYVKDGFIFGRGVSDNKSGAIGTLYVQKALRDLNVPLNHNIKLFLGTNEEKGMADVEYYVANYPVPQFSLVPDAGFPGACGEFGRLQFNLISKTPLSDDFKDIFAGSVFNAIPNKATAHIAKTSQIDLTKLPENFTCEDKGDYYEVVAPGRASHAAFPEGGDNALYHLTKELALLPGLKPEDKALLDFLTNVNTDSYGTYLGIDKIDDISGQTVSSGTVLRCTNGILTMTNDCRYAVTSDGDQMIASISAKCEENGYTLGIQGHDRPSFIDKNSMPVQTCQRVIREYLHIDKDIQISKGGTYAGKIPNALATGINTASFTDPKPAYLLPGHGGAHSPDECMSVAKFLDGIKLVATMILELDQVL